MPTTTYWTWVVECDAPTTGRRIGLEGEVIAPPDATEEELRRLLFPELNKQLQRQYGAGYRIEDLSPACRFDRK